MNDEARSGAERPRGLGSGLGRWVCVGLAAVLACAWVGCSPGGDGSLVVYTSQDATYATPIFEAFERETGIEVKAVYDSEMVKTVGLANRLLAERSHPRCDVFWSNEQLRTLRLAEDGVFVRTNGWVAFGSRARCLVVNTNRLDPSRAPRTLGELTNDTWRSRVALAYPLFGTTSAHFLALRVRWGVEGWERWCRGLKANRCWVVDGNSLVVRMVGAGEAWVGMTDSDDVLAGQREGLPIVAVPLREGDGLRIPNTVAVVRESEAARRLVSYLTGPAVREALVQAGALDAGGESGLQEEIVRETARAWEGARGDLEPATRFLREVFIR